MKTPAIFQNLKNAFSKRSVSLTSNEIIKLLAPGGESFTGENISADVALTVSAVFAAITIISEDVASLPLIFYRRTQGGRQRAVTHPYYSLMRDAPNPEHTSFVFREIMMGHLLAWGNFFGQQIYDGRGVVREIWPLAPNRMSVFRENGLRKYLYRTEKGERIAFTRDDILHIPAFGFDGLVGYSRIHKARNAIGLSRSTEKYGSKVFVNDARPSVVFTTEGRVDKDVKEAMRESWNQMYAGAGNAAKLAVLEQGLDLKEIGFPPEDAQFLQTRSFQVSEIARMFRIPPHMLGDVQKSTSWGTGIEQQKQGYLDMTLRGWLTRIEQQLNKDLLLSRDRRNYYFEHLTAAMLRADLKTRYEAYNIGVQGGWLSRNEIRQLENMNPVDGLDEYLVPLNMGPADQDGMGDEEDDDSRNYLPLIQDTLARAVRREAHEVSDAVKRWLKKDKRDKFEKWLEQFYKSDQPDYLRAVFAPYIQAGLLGQRQVTHVAAKLCQSRGEQLAEALAEQHDLEPITAGWLETVAADAAALMPRAMSRDKELNYE